MSSEYKNRPDRIQVGTLVRDKNKITKKKIEEIADSISYQALQLHEACLVNNIDPDAMNRLMYDERTAKVPTNRQFAQDMIQKARAKRQSVLLAEARKGGRAAHQKILEFVEPKMATKYRVQIEYEVAIILDIVESKTDQETYEEILEALSFLNAKEVTARYDAKIDTNPE